MYNGAVAKHVADMTFILSMANRAIRSMASAAFVGNLVTLYTAGVTVRSDGESKMAPCRSRKGRFSFVSVYRPFARTVYWYGRRSEM